MRLDSHLHFCLTCHRIHASGVAVTGDIMAERTGCPRIGTLFRQLKSAVRLAVRLSEFRGQCFGFMNAQPLCRTFPPGPSARVSASLNASMLSEGHFRGVFTRIFTKFSTIPVQKPGKGVAEVGREGAQEQSGVEMATQKRARPGCPAAFPAAFRQQASEDGLTLGFCGLHLEPAFGSPFARVCDGWGRGGGRHHGV